MLKLCYLGTLNWKITLMVRVVKWKAPKYDSSDISEVKSSNHHHSCLLENISMFCKLATINLCAKQFDMLHISQELSCMII